ncbi:hypothetical protein Ancab_031038 [Ancistrocladus abbreviatus]
MQYLVGAVKPVSRLRSMSSNILHLKGNSIIEHPQLTAMACNLSTFDGGNIKKIVSTVIDSPDRHLLHELQKFSSLSSASSGIKVWPRCFPAGGNNVPSSPFSNRSASVGAFQWASVTGDLQRRCFTTTVNHAEPVSQGSSSPIADVAPRIKFKRLDKTARHIMQILDKEAVEEVKAQREIPDVRPGYIVQLKVEVPENKRRVTTIKGIVIARRNAGLNTTFRLRRLVAGVGVESLFPLFSPNIKEIKILDKKKVRRAKLYHLREKMNALRK